MRVPPDQNHFEGGGDECVLEILREQPETQRHRAPAELLEGHTIQVNLPGVGRPQAGESVQSQSLPGPIAAEDGNHLASGEFQ